MGRVKKVGQSKKKSKKVNVKECDKKNLHYRNKDDIERVAEATDLAPKAETKGSISQEKKKEWKVLREQIRELETEKKKSNPKSMQGKMSKKEIRQKIKQLKADFEKKYKEKLDKVELEQLGSMEMM
mmetsp:Transcript_47212/g.54395  ORF Transcript_47212/g.54395 Transcript_47212/m.54395 type:complete len:127 (-) Transcript_47212:103-483(-)